ncbi:MAG: OFA family MFS transporter [Treponema sp.]|jgi:OFA family oxalate/formate antiporter-like MFS transporter|nr:OFA family MFS transporter [Treponema sp.]
MKKQGLFCLLAAIAIQLTLGIAYIWSVFQTGIATSIFNRDNAAAGLTFSLLLATLAIGSVIGGKLAARYSTRLVVFIGGIILSVGFFLASFVTANQPWLLWVTYGVMGGCGMGFTYSTTIACAQKWYPHKKGLVTGIIVASLGFGGVFFTPIVEVLIVVFGGTGTGEPKTFMVLSAIFLTVCTVGSLFLKNPPDGYVTASLTTPAAQADSISPSQMLKTSQFYLVTAAYMLACMGGLMMIAFAKPIAVAKGFEATAAIGVLAISMFNSIGRLVWGFVSDKLGRLNTIVLLLSCSAVLSLLVNLTEGYWIFILITLIGFFYGGLISTFPSLTADLFGAKHMAANYGFVLLGFGSGAIISSQIAGYYKNLAAENIDLMYPAFVIASCCAVAGIVLILMVRRKPL